jgi:hypothetical protein
VSSETPRTGRPLSVTAEQNQSAVAPTLVQGLQKLALETAVELVRQSGFECHDSTFTHEDSTGRGCGCVDLFLNECDIVMNVIRSDEASFILCCHVNSSSSFGVSGLCVLN